MNSGINPELTKTPAGAGRAPAQVSEAYPPGALYGGAEGAAFGRSVALGAACNAMLGDVASGDGEAPTERSRPPRRQTIWWRIVAGTAIP